jgi:spore germination cell wall hydrolase CwlJ-like protein
LVELTSRLSPIAYNINKTDEYCLAQNIFFEARSESDRGKIGVAFVTLNRVKNKTWPNTVCKVVWQRSQFSWTSDGKADHPESIKNIIAHREWLTSEYIAKRVLMGFETDPTANADHYHANYVNPNWAVASKRTAVIGRHLFYKLR